MTNGRPPIHPCEIFAEEIDYLGMSPDQLARVLSMSTDEITRILEGQSAITASMALRLSRWLGTGPELWMNLQSQYELRSARQTFSEEIERTVTPRAGIPQEAA